MAPACSLRTLWAGINFSLLSIVWISVEQPFVCLPFIPFFFFLSTVLPLVPCDGFPLSTLFFPPTQVFPSDPRSIFHKPFNRFCLDHSTVFWSPFLHSAVLSPPGVFVVLSRHLVVVCVPALDVFFPRRVSFEPLRSSLDFSWSPPWFFPRNSFVRR